MVLDWVSLWVKWEWPVSVKMDLLTEAGGHRIHEETGGWTLDVDIVG